jgi:hypothetical protein
VDLLLLAPSLAGIFTPVSVHHSLFNYTDTKALVGFPSNKTIGG